MTEEISNTTDINQQENWSKFKLKDKGRFHKPKKWKEIKIEELKVTKKESIIEINVKVLKK